MCSHPCVRGQGGTSCSSVQQQYILVIQRKKKKKKLMQVCNEYNNGDLNLLAIQQFINSFRFKRIICAVHLKYRRDT